MDILTITFTGALRPHGTAAERRAQVAAVADGWNVVDVITGHPFTYETDVASVVTLAVTR